MENIVRFTKEDRSSFPYWFAHWCAYQMTALNIGCWKIKYLFHDIEKPWLRLFWPYKKVQKWHNEHNSHHLINVILGNEGDWEGMIIDWECSRFTKKAAPLNAAQEYERIFNELEEFILTFNTNGNKTAEYIKNNNLEIYRAAYQILYAYTKLHIEFGFLNIEHNYRSDYLKEYFDGVKTLHTKLEKKGNNF